MEDLFSNWEKLAFQSPSRKGVGQKALRGPVAVVTVLGLLNQVKAEVTPRGGGSEIRQGREDSLLTPAHHPYPTYDQSGEELPSLPLTEMKRNR